MPGCIRLLFLGALLLSVCSCGEKRREQPVAVDGVLDLSDWDFEKDGIVGLRGEWRFVWEEFVKPMPIDAFRNEYKATIQVPAIWPVEPHPDKPGEFLPGQGYATYALEIRLPVGIDRAALAIFTRELSSAGTWMVSFADGAKEMGRMAQGVPGTSLDATTPVWVNATAPLVTGGEVRVMLRLHLSNFRHARGGTLYSPKLGLRKRVSQVASFRLVLDASIFGILFIIALYHFILFLQHREDRPSLFFALFCGATALRQWMTGQFSQELGMGLSARGFEVLLALEYMTMPLMLMSSGLFVHALVPGPYFRRFVDGFCVGLGAVLVVFAFLTEPLIFSANVYLYQMHLVLCGAIVFIYLVYKAFIGHVLARWVCLAFGMVIVGTVNDILHSKQIIQSAGYIGPYTFVAFVLMQSGILSGVYARAHRKAEHLGANLQKEVEEQTRNLSIKAQQAQEATMAAVQAEQEARFLRREAEAHSVELEELHQQKNHFFQNMSHELRTPLTLILNPLEEVASEGQGDERLNVALRNSRRLLRLVNQLLDFQKLSAGKRELKLEPINVVKFGRICGDYFSSACSTKKITFHTTFNQELLSRDTSISSYVQGDLDALETIVFNFLSNALKYTPTDGSITLAIEEAADRLRFYVKDTGPGISREGQQKLFQVFSQVDDSTTRAFEGTGLGLALAKELTEKMDGQVGVESEVGQGSSFWAEFPVATIRPLYNVLVVDDDPELLDTLVRLLGRVGEISHILSASGSEEARVLLADNEFKCILSDARMPGEDGASLLGFAAEAYPKTHRILITGQADQELMQRAVNTGHVHSLLYKPFDDCALIESVRHGIDVYSGSSGSVDESASREVDFQVRDWLLDLAFADEDEDTGDVLEALPDGGGHTILVVDDLPDMRELIASTLTKQGYVVIKARNGKEGLELAKAAHPHLIVTDWMMHEMSGPEMIEAIRGDESLAGIPTILLTAKSDEESKLAGKEIGADAFLGKPFNAQELSSTVRNLIQLKDHEAKVRDSNVKLTQINDELQEALQLLSRMNEVLEEKVLVRTQEIRDANISAIYMLAVASDAKDKDTGNHIQRVRFYSEVLAKRLGFEEFKAEEIGYSSMMHDVGKLAIPDKILKKPGRLNPDELAVMQTHAAEGARILGDSTFFETARDIARCHHEKYDGSGYPEGLTGDDIPIAARIVAVADIYDALSSKRVYKGAWSREDAVLELVNISGSHLDPTVVNAFLEIVHDGTVDAIHQRFTDRSEPEGT